MIDQADGRWLFLTVKLHRAIKIHKCGECGREILPGEVYERAQGCCDEGYRVIDTHKTCGHCCAAREWLNLECGGWLYTAVFEDLAEHAGITWDRSWVSGSARLLYHGMSKQWQGWTVEKVARIARIKARGRTDSLAAPAPMGP